MAVKAATPLLSGTVMAGNVAGTPVNVTEPLSGTVPPEETETVAVNVTGVPSWDGLMGTAARARFVASSTTCVSGAEVPLP